jgi:multiple sugar transport system permease protein
MSRTARFFCYVALCLWSLVVLFPLYFMVSTAFKERNDVYPDVKYIPWLQFQPTLSAWEYLRADFSKQITDAFTTSLLAASGSAVAATFLGALAGYALLRFTYKVGPWRNDDIAFWFVSQRMLPPVVVIFPFLIMFRFLGLLDTIPGLIIAYTLFNLPLAVWIMRDTFRGVPLEIEESALIDGASRIVAFLRVSLPLAAPGLAASLLLCFVFAWNEFLFGLMLTVRVAQPLPVLIASQANEQGSYWWTMAAISIIALTPVVIIWLALQRWVVRGLASGAFK